MWTHGSLGKQKQNPSNEYEVFDKILGKMKKG
jgi:hypothetical protein